MRQIGTGLYWLVRVGARLARRVPVRVSYALATAGADLAFALARGIRTRTTENFRWVLGPSGDPDGAARASLRNYAKYLVDFLRDDDPAAVEVRGVDHLHEAMSHGKGAIAIGFHIGNIDLGAAVLARVGYPVNVVVDTFEPPELDQLIQGQRVAKGLRIISLAEAPRKSIRALRQNEVLALLIDKPSPLDGVRVRFFGGEIAIPGGAAVLSLRTGAPIVPCCVFRRPGGRFVAEVAPPEYPGEQHDVQSLTQRIVDALEGWVRRHPEQWYPFRRMWLSPAS